MTDAEFARSLREPNASKEERELIARQIEDAIRQRDEDDIWPFLLYGCDRDEYVHAMRLVRAGIDMNSPDITLVRIEVHTMQRAKSSVESVRNAIDALFS